MKCDICNKKIKNHVFKRFGKILCANCYSIESRKKLNNWKYLVLKCKGE